MHSFVFCKQQDKWDRKCTSPEIIFRKTCGSSNFVSHRGCTHLVSLLQPFCIQFCSNSILQNAIRFLQLGILIMQGRTRSQSSHWGKGLCGQASFPNPLYAHMYSFVAWRGLRPVSDPTLKIASSSKEDLDK